MRKFTRNEFFASPIPDDVWPGPGVVPPAHQVHLLLLANHQLLLCLVAHQLCLRWRHCKKHMSQPFLRPKVMLKQLTEHIQLCIGSNWLVSSIGADLALVDSFVLERCVLYLQVEHSTVVRPKHGVSGKSRQIPVITCTNMQSSSQSLIVVADVVITRIAVITCGHGA